MLRQTVRTGLALALLLLAARASAADWKTQVTQAGGYWAGDVNNPGWNKIFAPDANAVLNQLPAGVRTMLQTEVQDNPWVTGHEEMQTKLGRFRPEAAQVFDLPFIPIPADKMKFGYESKGMNAAMRNHVTFTAPDGTKMVRFFFHPLYADKYKELIETYGVKYEYQAISTSSPRSLVMWKKGQPNKPFWVKVSLHATIDSYTKRDASGKEVKVGISRVQTEKKAYRSALVDAAFSSVQRSEPPWIANSRIRRKASSASAAPSDRASSNTMPATSRRPLASRRTSSAAPSIRNCASRSSR